MTDRHNALWNADERAYAAYLNRERHLFAWCIEAVGGASHANAVEAAASFYVYERADTPSRGLAFHEEAWHWAMLKLFGDGYWRTHPELEHPSIEYRKEEEKQNEN